MKMKNNEEWKINRIVSFSFVRCALVLFFIVSICYLQISCNYSISREQSLQIAETKLQEYCGKEGLKIEQFAEPIILSDAKHPWIYDYKSKGSPSHSVLIYINKRGDIEMHRMIETGK